MTALAIRARPATRTLCPNPEHGPGAWQFPLWAAMKEAGRGGLQQQVEAMARNLGYECRYHTWNSMHSQGGYPDLHCVGRGRSVFLEMKTVDGKMTPAHERWRDELIAAGHEYLLVRPCDLSKAEEVLR